MCIRDRNVLGAEKTNALQRIAMENGQSRLKVPLLFGYDVIHGYRTIFPISLAEAATWDPALVEKTAGAAAEEAAASGIRWTFAPMVDISREPRWGRIAEGSGEDPVLGSAMAAARVRGFQKKNDRGDWTIAACAKHFVGYGAAEAGREYNYTEISERTLREVYLPPFKAAVDAGAATLMSAFNDLDGIPASANPFTLTTVLRHEWGFQGFVVSDWDSVGQLVNHGIAATGAEAAKKALEAGVDMDMEGGTYEKNLAQLVKDGKVSQAAIDQAVRRILRIKFMLGLFDSPYTDAGRAPSVILSQAKLELARQAAQEAVVLLRNQNKLLPLRRDLRRIALIGPLADDKQNMLGNWIAQGRGEDAVSVMEGIKAKLPPGVQLAYVRGTEVNGDSSAGFAEAVEAARSAQVAVLVLGESGAMSGEASSRAFIGLPGNQEDLLKAVMETGVPVVLVLMNGRPLAIPWAAEHVPAILESWFLGVQAGNAIADVLFGDVNPSGKLPVTFPRTLGQVPIYYNHRHTGRPATAEKWTSKYLDVPNTPQFPFGYGLSYTTFRYSNMQVSAARLPATGGHLTVSAEIENTGDGNGDEVVQLYLRDLAASTTRPVKELKGFQRISLRPGEKRRVEFALSPDQLRFYDPEMKYVVEPGRFNVWIGPNSAEGVQGEFELVQ